MAVHAQLTNRCYDVAVYGAGYVGLASAEALAKRGLTVVLIDRRPTALWESGWAFTARAGASSNPGWQTWLAELADRNAARDGIPDGACTEALTAERLRRSSIDVAWYRTPVAVERQDGLLTAVVLGGKSGLSRVRAKRWIDASEDGEIAGLCEATWYAPAAARQETVLHLRRTDWAGAIDRELAPGVRWVDSIWDDTRRLVVESDGSTAHRASWAPALAALRAVEPLCSEAFVSHASIVAFPINGKRALPATALPANLVNAIPAWSGGRANDLAGRFTLGLDAADCCLAVPAAGEAPIAALPAMERIVARQTLCAVVVAGAGTGGALAALAAGRSGARTCAFDPQPFSGGIGTGGGIHCYYYGVKGGLQEELDQRTRELMPLFRGDRPIYGFHPDAKKLALDGLLADAGVEVHHEAMLVAVERVGRRVVSAVIATPRGPLRIQARTWVDGTGDGDLCERAGARSTFGRQGDGLPHAYTQSSGRAVLRDGEVRMDIVNFDAGWVDPCDDDDLTRARMEGISHYVKQRYDALSRPTYLAPAIGLRQGRQVITDRTITLDDLIVRRRHADGIGLTGCHYDNHAIDYQFESDEALFWVWGCRGWENGRTGGEIPLRALIPADLDNVLIASRALGVSQDAHHSLRMQRDMQRIGEVAGLLAALAAAGDGAVRAVPFGELRRRLVASGALAEGGEDNELGETDGGLGNNTERKAACAPLRGTLQDWLAGLRGVNAFFAMWRLSKAGEEAGDALAALLDDADARVSWRACVVLAMRGDTRAEPRLLAAIKRRENGFEQDPPERVPERFERVVYNWWTAIAMLRCCGTAACVPVLAGLLGREPLLFHCATTLAVTCARLATRLPAQCEELAALAGRLALVTPDPGPNGDPQHNPTTHAPAWRTCELLVEDRSWQFHLAVAQALQACGRTAHPAAQALRSDARLLVRRAFSRLAALPESASHRPPRTAYAHQTVSR